jgi:hypothetical protein
MRFDTDLKLHKADLNRIIGEKLDLLAQVENYKMKFEQHLVKMVEMKKVLSEKSIQTDEILPEEQKTQ